MNISPRELQMLREYFKNYGTVQPLLDQTGLHRMTVKRLLETGRATRDTVVKVRTFVNNQEIFT